MATENLKVETDSKTEEVTGEVAQPENKTEEIVSKEQAAEVKSEVTLPKTAEEYEKALQSASSKKMNEFLKKYNAAKLSDIEEKLDGIEELKQKIADGEATKAEMQKYKDETSKLQKIIDEQTPIIEQKKQADFLKENNINPEFAEDFFAIYEKKLNEDKSNSTEVIKQILENHPDMGAFVLNDVKTSTKNPEKENKGDGLNKIRKYIGLPIKN